MIFEGDALNIVNALYQEDPYYGCFGQLIEDTQVRLNSFQSCLVRHIYKEANEATHWVAKTTLLRSLDQVWMEECLIFIQSIVFAY